MILSKSSTNIIDRKGLSPHNVFHRLRNRSGPRLYRTIKENWIYHRCCRVNWLIGLFKTLTWPNKKCIKGELHIYVILHMHFYNMHKLSLTALVVIVAVNSNAQINHNTSTTPCTHNEISIQCLIKLRHTI